MARRGRRRLGRFGRTPVGHLLIGIQQHRRATSAAFAAALVALLVIAQGLVGAPASALPPGAYWYQSLDLANAWKTTRGAGVTVAVVDSGVQANLDALRGQVLPGLDLSGDDPSAQHDTAIAGSNGLYGHGTDMAAFIAGTGRNGLTGVAPQAKILPIDADHAGRNTLSADNTDKGIRWAVDHHADIINLSLGSPGSCDPGDAAAVEYAYRHDVIVVASSGDEGGAVDTPANCPGALAVGAIGKTFSRWSGSSSGPEVDFVAPGVDMIDQLLTGRASHPGEADSNGTSAATAIVSGTLALLRAKFPHDSARQIVTRALSHVHSGLGSGSTGKRISDDLGYGVILPRFALTESTPSTAPNPIYDRFAKELGTGSSSSAPSSSSSVSAPPDDSSAPAASSAPDGASSAPSSAAAAKSDDSGGFPIWIVIVIVVVVVAAIAVVLMVARGRRNRPRYGGPPPPGWGGPPGSSGPGGAGGWTG